MYAAFAISSRLRLRKARQSGVVDAAEFAINIGGLHVQVRKRRGGARIFVRPVEAGPGQQLPAAIVDPSGHAIAVQYQRLCWPELAPGFPRSRRG